MESRLGSVEGGFFSAAVRWQRWRVRLDWKLLWVGDSMSREQLRTGCNVGRRVGPVTGGHNGEIYTNVSRIDFDLKNKTMVAYIQP